MTTNMPLDYPAVMAFLAVPDERRVQILGSGVLVGSRTVLTAGHLVRSQVPARKLFWFSRQAGVLRVKKHGIYHPPVLGRSEAETNTQSDLVLVRLRDQVQGIEPLPVVFEPPAEGNLVSVTGFGGDSPGLFERRVTRVRGSLGLPGLFTIDPNQPLTLGDSGSAALLEGPGGDRVAGCFTNANFGGHKVVTTLELESVREWFESTLADIESGGAAPPRPEAVVFHTGERNVSLSARRSRSHDFELTSSARRMVVTVNATPRRGVPRPRLTVQLFHNGKPRERKLPSQFRSFLLIRNHKNHDRRLYPGTWRLEVTSESACDYEVHWTVYERS